MKKQLRKLYTKYTRYKNFNLEFFILALALYSHCGDKKSPTPHNFLLAFIDELEKQIIIKKTVKVGQ